MSTDITEYAPLSFMESHKKKKRLKNKKNKANANFISLECDDDVSTSALVNGNPFELSDEVVKDYMENASDIEELEALQWNLSLSEDPNEISDDLDDGEDYVSEDEIVHIGAIKRAAKKARKAHLSAIKHQIETSTGRRKGKIISTSRKLSDYVDNFVLWIDNSDSKYFDFPAVYREPYSVLNSLANKSGCKLTRAGKQRGLYIVLEKTNETRFPGQSIIDEHKDLLDKLEDITKQRHANKGKKKGKGSLVGNNTNDLPKEKKKSKATNLGMTQQLKHGAVVGSNANPIAENNKGHALLRKMGWAPGQALGSSTAETAIKDPLEAVFRQKKRGLGY